jgi:hypothetical protein
MLESVRVQTSYRPSAQLAPDPSSTGYRFQSTDLYGDVFMHVWESPKLVKNMPGQRCT